jgi:hypothetical protein
MICIEQSACARRLIVARNQPEAAMADDLNRSVKRRVARNLQFNQFEVPLAAASGKIDRATPVARTCDQTGGDRYLVRPVNSSQPVASGSDGTLYNDFGAAVMDGNLRLKDLPTPILARPIFIGGGACARIVTFDDAMYGLNQHRTIKCGDAMER